MKFKGIDIERAMAIYAHPDDAEFGMAGTVAKWAKAGVEVTYCMVTNGASGNWSDAEVPDAHAIRRFRNRNRLPVRQCLEKSLIRFYETSVATGRPGPQFDRLMKTEAGMRMHQAEIADLGFSDF